jgi:molybdopterin/thiamine biosynthesis adenylyltransferase
LLGENPSIQVFDKIESQLHELIKIKNPSVSFSSNELQNAIIPHIGNTEINSYGVWVYYPWSKRLVHLLDKEEFITLRTSRNQYKITPEEQKTLATKKVGVIGLSVGQSVSLTMAMERSFGEIRIADFDTIDTTNLNRIRTGLHNIGVKKTVVTAREIAEIDPYLNVTCFHDGITNENLENFFLNDGKIDALIEECDSINIKIRSRLKAKELRIPVIMDTSDRGMLDIERFDLETNRPIFHGLLDGIKFLNNESYTSTEKTEIINAILDNNKISERFKYSINEIGKTITTWPQLASSVVAGGANAADVYRRIMLNQSSASGRYYFDLEEII